MKSPSLHEIDPTTLKQWLDEEKAVLIDIREPDEYAREHIPQARLVPLSGFNPADFPKEHAKIGVFHCHSGTRTMQAAPQILKTGFNDVYYLTDGLKGWKAAGFEVNFNRKAPISIMRQVQIAVGLLVVLGSILAVLVSPWFIALSAFAGAGLAFAGISGTCAMANLLSVMPWNASFGEQVTGKPSLIQT